MQKGRAVLHVTFKSRASVDNLVSLKSASEDWWHVMRGIGMLTDTAVEDSRILIMEKGSPLHVELASITSVALAIGLVVDRVLNAADRYLDLKKKAADIRSMQLKNKQIEQELEEEAETYRESAVETIKNDVIEAVAPEKKGNGEVQASMTVTVKNVFNFLDRGGTVDCRVPENELPEGDAKKITDLYEKVRQLESKIEGTKLLREPEAKP